MELNYFLKYLQNKYRKEKYQEFSMILHDFCYIIISKISFGELIFNNQKNVWKKKARESTMRFGTKVFLSLFFGGVVGMKYGYETSQREKREKYLTEYQGEDWLSYKVKNMKKPIFIVYYTPGDKIYGYFRKYFLEAASLNNEKCDFVMVNCAKYYHQVKNIDFQQLPKIELIQTQKEIMNEETNEIELKNPIVKYNKDYSTYGMKCFLEQNGIIDYKTPEDGLIYLYSDLISVLLD